MRVAGRGEEDARGRGRCGRERCAGQGEVLGCAGEELGREHSTRDAREWRDV